MKLLFVLCGAFLLGLSGATRAEPPAYEKPRTQVLPIKESGTDRQYELYIKLPEHYSADTEKHLPETALRESGGWLGSNHGKPRAHNRQAQTRW